MAKIGSSASATWVCRWRRTCSRRGTGAGLDMQRAGRCAGCLRRAGCGGVKAAASVEIVITMLPAGAHVREVYLSADGVLASVGAARC